MTKSIQRMAEYTNLKIKVRTIQALLRRLADFPLDPAADADQSYQYYTALGIKAVELFDAAQNMPTPTYRKAHIRTKIYDKTYNRLFEHYLLHLNHIDYHLFGYSIHQVVSPLLDPKRIELINELKTELKDNRKYTEVPTTQQAIHDGMLTPEYITEIRNAIMDEARRYSPEDADYLPLIDRRIIAKLRREYLQNDSPIIQHIYTDHPPEWAPAIQGLQVVSYIAKKAANIALPDICRYRIVWYDCVQLSEKYPDDALLIEYTQKIMTFINVSRQVAIEQLQDY